MRLVLPAYDDAVDLPTALAFPDGGQRSLRAVFVASLDGAATVHGRAGGLGNEADRRLFALQRSLADVVLVGAGTVHAERYGPAEADAEWASLRGDRPPTPPLAVVSGDLGIDPSAALFTDARDDARTIVLTCASAPPRRRKALEAVADVVIAGDESVDLRAALDELGSRGLRRITCEGGPTLMAGLAGSGLVDELCLTLSPTIVAGDAIRITDGPTIADGMEMRLTRVLEDEGFLFLLYRTSRLHPPG